MGKKLALQNVMNKKRPGKLTKKILFNTPAQTYLVFGFNGDWAWLWFGSCDFAPFDNILFVNMKKNHLAGNQYGSDYPVISAVDDFLPTWWRFLQQWGPSIAITMKEVSQGGRMLKNKPHLAIFHDNILVILWNFQPRLLN